MLVIWLNGVIAKTKGWSRHFQANTEKRHTVLSVFFLGKRVLTDSVFSYSLRDAAIAFRELSHRAKKQVHFVGIN